MIAPNNKPTDHAFDEIPVESVRSEFWAKVLVRSLGRPPDPAELELSRLMSTLQAAIPGSEALDALHTIVELGHEAGQAAIETAMQKTNFRFPGTERPVGAHEVALALWLAFKEGRDNGALNLAHVLCAMRGKRAYKHLRGQHVRPFRSTESQRQAFEGAIAAWCVDAHIEGAVEMRIEEVQGEVVIKILRGSSTLVIKDRVTTKIVVVVPSRNDVIRFSPTSGSLSISATTQLTLLGFYARKFGEIFFQDPEFFSTTDILDLQPFSDPSKLDNYAEFGIDKMIVSTIIVEGAEGQVGFKGKGKRDCYRVMRDIGVSITDRVIKKVVLKVWFSDAEARRKQSLIVLETPYDKAIPDNQHGERFREFLRHHGVLGGRPRPTDDPWMLLSGDHPWQSWTDELEGEAGRMKEANLIISTTPTSLPVDGNALNQGEVRNLPMGSNGTVAVVVGNDPEGNARLIGITDLDSYRLDVPAFANHLRGELRLEHVDSFEHQDFIHLGIRRLTGTNGDKTLSIYFSINRPASTPAVMERLIKGGPRADEVVMLVPTGADPALFSGAHIIPWRLPGMQIKAMVRTIVERLGWLHLVRPTEWSGSAHLLTVMAKKGEDSWAETQAWIGENEMNLEEAEKRTLHDLAVSDGHPVPCEKLSPLVCSCHKNAAASRITALRNALGLTGKVGRSVFKNHRPGYSLNKREAQIILR